MKYRTKESTLSLLPAAMYLQEVSLAYSVFLSRFRFQEAEAIIKVVLNRRKREGKIKKKKSNIKVPLAGLPPLAAYSTEPKGHEILFMHIAHSLTRPT